MKQYVTFIKQNRKILITLLVVINIIAIYGITQLNISGDFTVFIPVVSENQELIDEMDDLFPSSDQVLFMIPLDEGVTFQSYDTLREIESHLSSISSIIRFRGPAPESISMGTETLVIDESDPTSIMKLNTYYRLMGDLSPIIKHKGITYALFTLFIDDSFNAEDIHLIEDKLDELNLEHFATGDSYMQLMIFDYILTILRFIPPLALFFVLLIFGIQLQSFKATALSILPAAMGAIWTMGIIGLSGQDVSIITVLSPIFTIVIGSADGLHFISHVQDEEDSGHDNITSLSKTLSIVGKPMIITTITSMVGFLALLTMNTHAVKDLAVFASLGIFLAGVITWCVLPVILTGKMTLHRHRHGRSITFNFLKKTWGRPSLLIILLGIIVFGIGLPRVATEFNMLMVYKESTDIYKNTEKIQSINNGSIPIYVYGTTDENPLYPNTAKHLSKLSAELLDSPYVNKVLSPYSIIETIIPLVIPSVDAYPENTNQIDMMTMQLTSIDGLPINELVNLEKNAIKLVVFPTDLNNKTLQGIKSIVDKYNTTSDSSVLLETTGIQYMMMDLNDSMFDNQLLSTSLALIVVFLLLLMSLRQLKPALISLIPITVTILFLYGFLGITGISLNILTTTIFSITIGVGIDYAIHYTSVFMHLKKEGMLPNEAANKAYHYSARPIIANALGLALGMSALLLSPLQIHMNLTMLMWATMIVSVLFSLTFLPSALKKIRT